MNGFPFQIHVNRGDMTGYEGTDEEISWILTSKLGHAVTRRAGVDRARSSGRSGSEFGRTWLQRAGRCADSAFVSGLQSR